ncbi:MAG: hypothetical protein V7K68_29040 [Nostoc sp.]|uniref:hypothetical protein n=1 Tax=Nostoc sp. TaxID=1180 RepID=UPI002FFB08C0
MNPIIYVTAIAKIANALVKPAVGIAEIANVVAKIANAIALQKTLKIKRRRGAACR